MSYKDKPIIKLYKYENNSFVMQAQIDDFQEVSFGTCCVGKGRGGDRVEAEGPGRRLYPSHREAATEAQTRVVAVGLMRRG